MKRILYIVLALIVALPAARAQQDRSYLFGGSAFTRDALSTGDLLSLSQRSVRYGTARSMAMAGAFTSLGADQSSMVLNPAGLGMYRAGEFVITPMVSSTSATTPGTLPFESNSRSRFALGNVGVVFNAYEGEGSLLSVNFGFAYTRLADYNYSYSFGYAPSTGNSSMADAMSVMLEAAGATLNGTAISIDGRTDWYADPFFWPAVAGYKTFAVDRNPYGVWYPGEIGNNAAVEGATTVRSRGSAGEYSLAMGMNWNNKFYFGFTLGIESLYQRQSVYYGEAYSYNGGNGYDSDTKATYADGTLLPRVMQSMGLQHDMRLDGTGVNFKLGMVYRPIEPLRIGVAFHTPTFYSIDRRYSIAMATVSLGETSETDATTHRYTSETISDVLEDAGPNSWDLVTPTRLLLGASYTFGQRAILSVDYERTWYNATRLTGQPYLAYGPAEADFKQDFKHYCQAVNTVRVGAEVRPIPMISLRAGFSYAGSLLKDKSTIFSSPTTTECTTLTAGVGFQLGRSCYIDLAYCYASSRTSDYMLFYGNSYPEAVSSARAEIYESAVYSTKFTQHNAAMTFGVRF